MHYFLYPTKDATISNYPTLMYKNMGLDEVLEVEKRISLTSCASTLSYSMLVGYTSSSIELLDGPMSASFDSGSTDPKIVSSSFVQYSATTRGSVLSRALLQFDFSEISRSLSLNQISNPRFYLNLKICESLEVPTRYTLAAYPVSGSWLMGTGYKYDGQKMADGVSWKFRDGDTIVWSSGSLVDCSGGGVWYVSSSIVASGSGYAQPPFTNQFNPFPDCPGCSYVAPDTSSKLIISGGYAAYQHFDYQAGDVKMDITRMVYAWMSGSFNNEGLILMHSDESSSVDYGALKFFSKETNTIYSPYVDVAWEDAVIDTGSADPIQIRDCVVNMKNMSEEYKFGSIIRMDVAARKRYPVKTFTNRLSDYLVPYYLPSASYYQIKDAESEETIIPYDSCTRLSFDGYGNYFMLDTSGLPMERYFKVEIRTEQSGSIMTFPIQTAFKISR